MHRLAAVTCQLLQIIHYKHDDCVSNQNSTDAKRVQDAVVHVMQQA